MPGRIGFDFQFSQPRARSASARSEENPMRILVMGDFSGRASRGVENAADLASRPIVAVDVDSFEQVLAGFSPVLLLSPGKAAGTDVVIEFRQLDDFHPGRLYRELDLFQSLRKSRSRLQDPATFAEAAEKLQTDRAQSPRPDQGPATGSKPTAENDAATLERLLGRKAATVASKPVLRAEPAVVDELIRKIVAPHIVPDAPPHQAQYVASVDAAIEEQMRVILHDPAFQALESGWLAIHWLISELEFGEQLQLFLLDVTLDELRSDARAADGNPEQSSLYRLLVEQGTRTPGGEPWSLLAGNYAFGPDEENIELLAFLGAIASQAGGPFVAAAESGILGCRSLADTPDPREWQPLVPTAEQCWQALRRSSVASWIGLALPRILLRAPYGKRNERVEEFEFEELPARAAHEHYLWGNPAIACALLIGRSFLAKGWSMEVGDERDIGGLPACVLDRDGEKELLACAEAYLSERAGEAILARGLMPLLSLKNQNAACLMRFQSLAEPAQAFAGPWR
ncbi:MAG TPA: type VI secretion system contractile sheath large subunit [Burkholderiales bacterium]|nr:type VI secretion system contractile sheath large subunit [Burkholderiales bacterium]